MPPLSAVPIADLKFTKISPASIDTFGDLCKLREAFAPTEAAYQKLRKALVEALADEDPAAEFVVTGERYTLPISACGFENKPDIPAVRKALGAADFLAVAQVTKTALEQFMLKPDIEALCVETQTGPRKMKPIPIAQAG